MGVGWGGERAWRVGERMRKVLGGGCSQVTLAVKNLPVNAGDVRDQV